MFDDCTAALDNSDYTTIHPAWGGKWVACLMRYYRPGDEYRIHQSWGPVSKVEAEIMAKRWARQGKIDYR